VHLFDNGVCITCDSRPLLGAMAMATLEGRRYDPHHPDAMRAHVLDNGICLTCRVAARSFNPSLHPHDPHNGEFIGTPGSGLAKKLLKGADALDAAPTMLGRYGFERGGGTADPDALHFFSGHGYIEVNAHLRDGRSLSTEGKAGWATGQIDEAMGHSPLTHDVQVHRGVGHLRMLGEERKSYVGLEFRDAGFASTTADPNVAAEYFGGEHGGAILDIRVPAGTKAIQLSGMGRKPRNGIRPPEHEAELLLDRGLTYRVIGDRVIKGVRHLEVEVSS